MTAALSLASTPRIANLREELKLHEGPPGHDGDPTWTLEDPLRDRFYRIGATELEMLARWHLGTPEAIAAAIRQDSPLDVSEADVTEFARFLASSNLLQVSGDEANARLLQQIEAQKMHWAKWMLKNYLFVRIPLVRPVAFLRRTLPLVEPLYGRPFFYSTVAAGLLGLALSTRQWETFLHTFLHFFTLEGAMLAMATLVLSKVLHELGHAYTAARAGCRVGTMGVALLVLWPVLYTDTSGAWTLKDKRRRLAIGGAGMAVELGLACWATLAWSFLPDGGWRSAAFTLATTSWVLTLLVNLNPLMRFDGYYLLSDLLDVANLQERSFMLARWHLRELLFGLGEPKPEHFDRQQTRILLIYAYSTWVYRFFLFLGIALLVYHMFFKILGIFLFLVEIGWFIARPVITELREWLKKRHAYRWNWHTSLATGAVGLALLLVLIPWQNSVTAPALLQANEQIQLYAPVDGKLSHKEVGHGQFVDAQDVLYRFVAPDLEHELAQLNREIVLLTRQSSFQAFSREGAANLPIIRRSLSAALLRREALRQDMDRLVLIASITGRVADVAEPVAVGDWLAKGDWLATVVSTEGKEAEAYVNEADLRRVRMGASARFIPEDPAQPSVALTVTEIAFAASRKLSAAPELGSPSGGGIAALMERDQTLTPEQSVYRVVLHGMDDLHSPKMTLRGHVVVDAEAQSLAGELMRTVLAAAIRELGF